MQQEHVDVVRAQFFQRGIEIGHEFVGRQRRVAFGNAALGRDDDGLALVRLEGCAEDALSPIRLGRVEEGDAEIDCLAYQPYALRLARPRAEPKPAVAAAAETGDGDFQAGVAEAGVVHGFGLRALAAWKRLLEWLRQS